MMHQFHYGESNGFTAIQPGISGGISQSRILSATLLAMAGLGLLFLVGFTHGRTTLYTMRRMIHAMRSPFLSLRPRFYAEKAISVALLSGFIAGLFVTVIQSVLVTPLILEAESYEQSASAFRLPDSGEKPWRLIGHEEA